MATIKHKSLYKFILITLINSTLFILVTAFIPNSIDITDPYIMGCEEYCTVVATGYPLPFIVDNPSLSPVNSVDLFGVLTGLDNINLQNLLFSFVFWIGINTILLIIVRSGKTVDL